MPGNELDRRDLKPWLDCRRAHELRSRQREAPLGAVRAARLRWHLAVCESCRRVRDQFTLLGQATRRIGL